jgi:hypothetical protein
LGNKAVVIPDKMGRLDYAPGLPFACNNLGQHMAAVVLPLVPVTIIVCAYIAAYGF